MLNLKEPSPRFAKLITPVVAIGPAALFAFMWRWLNAEFPPFLPAGFDSPLACLLAGFFIWVKIWDGVNQVADDGNLERPVRSHIESVFLTLLVAAVAIPFGRIVFSVIPPWSNGLGAIIGLAIGNIIFLPFLLKSKGRFVHQRGTVLLNEAEARQKIQALPMGAEPRIKWAGFDLPGEIAEGNFLCVGAIGTGKTRMHRQILASIVPNVRAGADRRILIYDVKCDLLSELSTMELATDVLVFNPFDTRSVAWDIAADITSPTEAKEFAQALILPEKDGRNSFFTQGARAIVAGVIESLNRSHPGSWSLRHLVLLTGDKKRLEKVLTGTDLISRYFSPPDTFDNINNTIANAMTNLEPIAALWERVQANKISLKTWARQGNSILVLAGRENLQASLEPINRVAFKIIVSELSSGPESARRSRFWFFCDELKIAGRLEALPNLLNGRSKGIRCVIGFQDLEGLVTAYDSREIAKEISSRCKTISWLKITSPDTAKWASERSGELEQLEYLDTQSKDGTSTGEHLAKRESLLPSQFMHLPEFSSGIVRGFHLIMGLKGVFEAPAKYDFGNSEVKDFSPRPGSEQQLVPWSTTDETWLAQEGPATKEDSKKGKTKLDSFPRIDF